MSSFFAGSSLCSTFTGSASGREHLSGTVERCPPARAEQARCLLSRHGPPGGVRLDRLRAGSGRARESARAARGRLRAVRHRDARGALADPRKQASGVTGRLGAGPRSGARRAGRLRRRAAPAPARTRTHLGRKLTAVGRARGEGSDRLGGARERLGPARAGSRSRSRCRAHGGGPRLRISSTSVLLRPSMKHAGPNRRASRRVRSALASGSTHSSCHSILSRARSGRVRR